MRPLEALYLIGLLLALMAHPSDPRRRWMVSIYLSVVLLAHLGLEGWRWQMMPAYIAGIAIIAGLLNRLQGRLAGLAAQITGGGMTVTSIVYCVIWPVIVLPLPTGPYPVGTITARVDGIPVLFWYPSVPGSGDAPYAAPAWGLRSRTLHLVRTAATAGATLSPRAQAYPLVLYAPWWGGTREMGTVTGIDLASHGFIIAAIDDVVWDKNHDLAAVQAAIPRFDYATDAAAVRTFSAADARVDSEARKLIAVLNGLERGDGPFRALRIDDAHVGLLGFSFGGASVAEASRLDSRIKAVVNLDGWLFGQAAKHGVDCPYLLVSTGDPLPPLSDLQSPIPARHWEALHDLSDDRLQSAQIARGTAVSLMINGAEHVNFSDRGLDSPLRSLTQAGPIDPKRALEILDTYIVAFLSAHLQGIPSPLLKAGVTPFPEASLKIRPS